MPAPSNPSSPSRPRTITRVILWILAVIIGLPVLLALAAFASFWYMDKTNGKIISSGLPRRYLLYVPRSYDSSKPTPLIISFHPAATWPAVERNISRWNDFADQHDLIIAYPAGTGALFGGLGPGPEVFPMGPESGPRDVKFISDLIDKLTTQYTIDPNRIYVDGMSNGASMAIALSCKLSNRIAAVGAVSPAQPRFWDPCADSRPMPLILFHGTADKLALYHGGSSPIAPGTFPDIPNWVALAAKRNRCQDSPADTPVSPHVRRLSYTNCPQNADVIFYSIEGGGHTWPGGQPLLESWSGSTTREINATQLLWDFFSTHPYKP